MTRVLFVCSGNICRSPYAEYAARARFGEGYSFASAGTVALTGDHATGTMQEVGAERGLDLAPHRATLLTEAQVPDLVFGMEQEHLIAARRAFPDLPKGSIRLLAHPQAVADPYGRHIDLYRRTATQIDEALSGLLDI